MKKKIPKKRTTRNKTKYCIFVQYAGYSDVADGLIKLVAGRPVDSSGCGLGFRDLEFYFKSRDAAVKALAKLEKLKFLTGLGLRVDVE